MLIALAVLAGSIAPPSPRPIVRRHDRSDAAYVALARRFPAVGSFGRLGCGTLVSSQWVVTAAHVARGVSRRMASPSFTVGGHDYQVSAVFLHPDWTDLGDHDIALVKLDRKVSGVTPARLYAGARESLRTAYLVGNGKSGTGDSSARQDDDRWRAATSRVDSVSAAAIFLSFDAPPSGTTLEGAPSAGDSGGPALLLSNGKVYVAGISSAGFDGRNGPASYGAIDAYTRVSQHAAWAREVMAGHVSASVSAVAAAAPMDSLPAGAMGDHARAFVLAMRIGGDSAITAFLDAHFDSAERDRRPMLHQNLTRLATLLHDTHVLRVRSASLTSVVMELQSQSGGPVVIELVGAADAPHLIVDWRRYD